MGLNNSFQLTSLLFALLKLFFLFAVAFQLVSTCNYRCQKDERTILVFVAILMTFFPILDIMGILMKNLALLRVCKLYCLIEKSAIIFLQLVGTCFFIGGLTAEYFQNRYLSARDRLSVALFYAVDCILLLLIVLYMIFRNWMYNGTIESVKQDIAEKRGEQFVMVYNAGDSA